MNTYLVSGLGFASDIEFPELAHNRTADPVETIFGCASRLPDGFVAPRVEGEFYHHWHAVDGSPWLSFAKQEGGYLLRFADCCCFAIDKELSRVVCVPEPTCGEATIRHLFVDQIWPLMLAQRGSLVLHASAVRLQQHAIAFLGSSGSGKSTLASCFTQRGAQLLSDDFLLVEPLASGMLARGSYPGVRLWQDVEDTLFPSQAGRTLPVAEYTDKRRFDLAASETEPTQLVSPIKAVFLLTTPAASSARTELGVEQLSAHAAFPEVLRNAYVLDVQEAASSIAHFHRVAHFVRRTPLYWLSYPADLTQLPQVVDTIQTVVEAD